MKGFLLAEEGPFAGLVVRLEEGEEWIVGRDPDVCHQVLEDPMVSRKHVIIHKGEEGFVAENLSAVNPALLNGKQITEQIDLKEGDFLQIGNVDLRFTYTDPVEHAPRREEERETETPTIFEEADRLDAFAFTPDYQSRWLVKVTGGPNTGAEFYIAQGSIHIIGKDPHSADIVFQDMSVSRKHAKITCDEDNTLSVEDLGSRNGIAVNGKLAREPLALRSQDTIVLGTTHMLVIDTEKAQETVVSPLPLEEEKKTKSAAAKKTDWKNLVIPKKHLIIAGAFMGVLTLAFVGLVTLFRTEEVVVEKVGEPDQIEEKLKDFPSVEYSYTPGLGKLFLVGHVLTEVEHQELRYLLKSLPFIHTINDNVVVDELVWENTNAMLVKDPDWRGVYLTSSAPGQFTLKGYVKNNDQAGKLEDWIHRHFAYTNKLRNNVVVENTLHTQIQSLLKTEGLATVTFQLTNGEVVLAGRIPEQKDRTLEEILKRLKQLKGVRTVENYVISAPHTTEHIDVSDKYSVTGTSKLGDVSQFVVINGKILAKGEKIDGMLIKGIDENAVFLEKDGLKYKINYNHEQR